MLIFRLRELLKHEHVESSLKQLIRNEKFTKEQLSDWQLLKLKNLLDYLSKNNPYFSQYIKNNNVDLGKGYKDVYEMLSQFQVTDKKVIRDNFDKWLSAPLTYDTVQFSSTSGSSGIPFKFYGSPMASDYKTASKYRLYHRFGIKMSDFQLCLGSGFNSEANALSKLKVALNDKYVNHRCTFDVSNLTDGKKKEFINLLNSQNICSVWGYTSALVEIANYSLNKNLPIKAKHLKAVIYSGEGHDDYQDAIIRRVFNVPTIDEYNSVEGFIAGNCKSDHMHMNEDVTIFEVLRADGTVAPYGKGELLITNLFNKDFPFIRYKNGDVVELVESNCTCGSCFKELTQLDGRSSSFIINGDVKVPHALCTHYIPHSDFRTKVKKFQYVQDDIDKVVVKIVLVDKNIDCGGLEVLLRDLFNNIEVVFQYVDDIPCEKSGKFKDVINNLLAK